MLKQIEIQNFRSFSMKQTFTMEALPPSAMKEHPEHIIPIDGGGVLKLGSVYGPNGSGKSNLIRALSFFEAFRPVMGDIALRRSLDNPFLGSGDKVVSLAYTFIDSSFETILSLSYSVNPKAKMLLDNGSYYPYESSPYLIVFEKLQYREIGADRFLTAYVRDKQEIKAPFLLSELGVNSFAVPNNQLLVNFLVSQYSSDGVSFKAVASCNEQIFSLVKLGNTDFSFYKFISQKDNCDYLAKKLNSILATNIIGIYLDRGKGGYSLGNLKFSHKTGDKTYTLSFFDESEGTQKLTAVIAGLKSGPFGRIYYADDFDSHLHPVLIQALLTYLGSEENTNSQFIFNSHDILNMDSKYFRRDEIWFTTLDEEGSTKLYALSDLTGPDGRVIRNDKKYSKQYLAGHYGADPFIAKGLKL